MEEILKIENLHVSFDSYAGEVHAVRGVSLEVHKGEVLAIVGESGCGKSVTAQTIMKLNPMPPARIKEGSITLCGKDIVAASEKEMQGIRGQMVSMIFQDPMTCMNPTMRVGKQLTETLVKKGKISREDAEKEAVRLLKMVQIPNAEERAKQYPHEFSGGQRQRIGIARALAAEPEFIVCDEPISALDVSIQAQVINILEELQDKFHFTYLFISHDLSMVRHISTEVGVMYLGNLIEYAQVDELYDNMLHPYTQSLISAVPVADPKLAKENQRIILEGDVPSPINPAPGCPFRSRCRYAKDICGQVKPELKAVNDKHKVACHLFD